MAHQTSTPDEKEQIRALRAAIVAEEEKRKLLKRQFEDIKHSRIRRESFGETHISRSLNSKLDAAKINNEILRENIRGIGSTPIAVEDRKSPFESALSFGQTEAGRRNVQGAVGLAQGIGRGAQSFATRPFQEGVADARKDIRGIRQFATRPFREVGEDISQVGQQLGGLAQRGVGVFQAAANRFGGGDGKRFSFNPFDAFRRQ